MDKKILFSRFYEIFLENISTYIILQNHAIKLMKQKSDEEKKDFLQNLKPQKIIKDVYIDVMKKVYPDFKLDFSKFKEIQFRNHLLYLYTELEFYFFKSLMYVLTNRPALLKDKNISISVKSIINNDYNLEELVLRKNQSL